MALSCPRCGAAQPFEVKCVRCDSDIAASYKSEKQRLRLYGGAVVFLFIAVVALAMQNARQADKGDLIRSIGARSDAPSTPSATPAEEQQAAPPQDATDDSAAARSGVVVFAQKKNFFAYKILDGFKDYFSGKINILGWEDLRTFDSTNTAVMVAVGEEGLSHLEDFPTNVPLVVLAPLGERPINAARENTYFIPSALTRDQEVAIIHRLFPEAARIFLVTSDSGQAPSDAVLRELNVRCTTLAPDAGAIERELDAIGETSAVVWFHHIAPKDIKRMVSPSIYDRVPTVAWSALETSAPTAALAELRPSAKGVGTQGALLVNRLVQKQAISASDLAPVNSIQVTIRYSKAASLTSVAPPDGGAVESVIERLRNAAAGSGFETTLIP